MPKSVYILFTSKYPNHSGLEIGDEVVARLAHFNREPRRFRIVDIKEVVEDHELRYIYYGLYIGPANSSTR